MIKSVCNFLSMTSRISTETDYSNSVRKHPLKTSFFLCVVASHSATLGSCIIANWMWQGRPGRRKFRPLGRRSCHSLGGGKGRVSESWSTLCAVSHAIMKSAAFRSSPFPSLGVYNGLFEEMTLTDVKKYVCCMFLFVSDSGFCCLWLFMGLLSVVHHVMNIRTHSWLRHIF